MKASSASSEAGVPSFRLQTSARSGAFSAPGAPAPRTTTAVTAIIARTELRKEADPFPNPPSTSASVQREHEQRRPALETMEFRRALQHTNIPRDTTANMEGDEL